MRNLFNKYLMSCLEEKYDIDDNLIGYNILSLPTFTGFAAYANITKQSLYKNYFHREDFNDLHQHMRDILENILIEYTSDSKQPSFGIFLMKNYYNYKDKSEQNVTQTSKIEFDFGIDDDED